jgi:tRNA modification GTPase
VNQDRDTIAAIATPPGRGGIGVLRVSGPVVPAICAQLLGHVPRPRHTHLTPFLARDGSVIDEGIALYFPAPGSFTGEDVLELQGHGGPVVMDMLLARTLSLGARVARPGEFSERAFLNDKLDLAQAEAIADLIDSASAQAARAAVRSLRGEFSARVTALVESLVSLRMYVEAAIDFPDEDIDFLSDGKVGAQLVGIRARFDALATAAQQGSVLREGMTIVIAGRPNAGKSSLLNRLAGHDAAIVTDIPGTTRDLLREHINIDGLPVHIIDTAGLRDSTDAVEQEGVRRAWDAIRSADRVLLVVDDTQGLSPADTALHDGFPSDIPVTVIFNKIDLSGRVPDSGEQGHRFYVALSAKSGEGMNLLRRHLKAVAGFQEGNEDSFMARRRHLDALGRTREHLDSAQRQLDTGTGELLAEELRLAQQALGEITGEFSNEDLLTRIFASFCIGK